MNDYGNTLFEEALTYQNKDYDKYIMLLEQAANHNNKHALFRLAIIYLNSYGVKKIS